MDYEKLRLRSHEREIAFEIKKERYDVIVKDALKGNVGAAKVLANLMYHFEDIREKLKDHLNEFVELSRTHGFIYARVVFWITSSLGKEKDIQKRLVNVIQAESSGTTRDELMRALCNLGKLDFENSKVLFDSMKFEWNESDIETLFIIYNPILDLDDVQRIVKQLESSSDLLQILRSLETVTISTNRKLLRGLILPSKKSNQGTEIKSKLEKMLQSNHTEQVMAAGDFCMALVDRKPARLVYHFGYGKIAGYFYMKKINLKQPLRLEVEISSDEEDLKNLKSSELDVISGEIKDYSPPHISEMTQEEKEAEAEKLIGLLKKLEDTGIVKVIPK